MKKSQVLALYSFVMGLMLILSWILLLITGNPALISDIESKPVEIIFVVIAEFLIAFTLLIASYGLIKKAPWRRDVFILGNGMLLYSMINNLGFSIQTQEIASGALMLVMIPLNVIAIYVAIWRFETP